jgi:flavin reductase (DIM6/NTAB) family NADH-FMN oxidoreductase RutF
MSQGSMAPVRDRDRHYRTLRNTFGCFPSGVVALAGLVRGEPVGMAASSFASVSLEPPLASVCIASESSTWPRLREAASIGVTVLSRGQSEICRRLAGPSHGRFTGVEWTSTGRGAIRLGAGVAWFDCSIEDEVVAGDHTIVILGIRAYDGEPAQSPLVFHGGSYRELL